MSKLERTNVHLLNTHGGSRGGVNVFLVSHLMYVLALKSDDAMQEQTQSLSYATIEHVAQIGSRFLAEQATSMQKWHCLVQALCMCTFQCSYEPVECVHCMIV